MNAFKRLILWFNHLIGRKVKKKERHNYKTLGASPDKPDSRDYPFSIEWKPLPESYIIEKLPPIRNQKWIGSCCSHAVVGAFETIMLNYYPRVYLEGSELFHYYNARKYINESYPDDRGMTIRDGCKTANKFGIAPEYTWKYVPDRYNDKPPKVAYWFAKLYEVERYERVLDLESIKQALIRNIPVIVGIKVYTSFYDINEVDRVYYPKGDYRGGHAVLVVGYDDTNQWFKIRNSWGENWGSNGYFYMKYDDFERYSFDWWIIWLKHRLRS